MDLVPLWFVLPTLERGGAERVVAELARRMPARGFAPVVCCLESEAAPIGRELSEAGVEVIGLRLHRRNTLACARALARLFEKRAPALVQAHLFHANLATRLAVKFMQSERAKFAPKVIGVVHVQERRFRPWQFWLDRSTARWCALEVCVSNSVEHFHREKTGLPTKFFRVIDNGVALERFRLRGPMERAALRQKLGLNAGTRLALAVGRLDPQKDHATLFEAWRQAQPAQAELWIAGEGPERAALSANLPPGVKLLGFRTDVADLLAACDLFVQSSAWEGQPLTVLEALATGCAVALSDIEPHREIIEDGVSGVLLKTGSVEAWTRALPELLDGVSRRAALGTMARHVAETRFSVEGTADRHAAIFREVLGQGQAAAPLAAGI